MKTALMGVLSLCTFWAQAQLYSVAGKVTSTNGSAVPGALIHLHELEFNTVSDENGEYRLEGLKAGTYHLHIRSLGFEEAVKEIILKGNYELDIVLNEAYRELDEVVVESSFMNTDAANSSQSLRNIDDEAITRASAGSFVNALEELPGLTAINTGVGIAKPVIRGMSFNRVLVNDNGIKQEGQQWGSDHGLEIDQFNVSRVEVVKGPATLMYGSDALGGAINILPARIPERGRVNGQVRGIYRSNNDTYGSSYMIENAFDGWYARARYSMLDFGDYRVPAEEFIYNSFRLNIENERLKNTAGRERNGAITVGLRKNWGSANITVSRFDQKAGLFAGAIGIPRSYNLIDDGDMRNIDLPSQETVHDKVAFNSLIKAGRNWLEIQAGFQRNDRKELTLPHAHGVGPVPEGNLALNLVLQTYTLNARYRRRVNDKTRDVYGISGQYQTNTEEGYEHLLSPYNSMQSGIYAMRQYQATPTLVLSGGLRFDYGQILVEEFSAPVWVNAETIDYMSVRNDEVEKSFYNYSASAGLSWFMSPKVNVKFNAGRSFRIPTPAELSINGVHHGTFRHELGNSDLTSEKGYQLDFATVFSSRELEISFSPYANFFQDYIYLSPTSSFGYTDQTGNLVLLPEAGQTFQYRQDDAIISGFEFLTDYQLFDSWHMQLGAEYVYKYNLETSLPLPFTPPPSVNTGLEYEWKMVGLNWNIGGQYKRFFDQNNVDRNELATPGYELVNFSAFVNGEWGKKDITLFFKVRNALDTRYFNHLSRYRLLNLPEQGRDFILNLVINFSN